MVFLFKLNMLKIVGEGAWVPKCLGPPNKFSHSGRWLGKSEKNI
jgi:hypothetical protein